MNKESSNLGPFLASTRQHKKLTLRAVEAKTGISNAYLSQLERGKIRSPSPVMLRKLSDLYDIPYSSVLELAGYPVPDNEKLDTSLTDISARLGPVTTDEADELADYLKYLRTKRSQKR
ncbi:helix-turn-helix domain-containing protein [Nodosilinea sp. PGN35]|uniref:helix-turn-helix domain-containing protein n=1 Tax=Nodosilinea sp. PGN35 TaxID=3020489 RepID=UPI00398B306A